MSAFTITRDSNSVTINSYTDQHPGKYKVQADTVNNICLIDGIGFKTQINLAVDTVEVNGVAFSGTAAELVTLLYKDVFTDGALKINSKATSPVATDIPAGFCAVYKNTGSGVVSLWVNDGGVMKSVALA
jgi:hypothetical protein